MCAECAADVEAHYESRPEGVVLVGSCADHGDFTEYVERDEASFRDGYEREYTPSVRHMALPVTYRCNMSCKYCYSRSNEPIAFPADRPVSQLVDVARAFDGNITLIGGEPTVREDLPDLISRVKTALPGRTVSVATNGQRLARPGYVEALREAGMDFVFLSLNAVSLEPTDAAYRRKVEALRRCHALRIPVWLQRTVDDLRQVDSMLPIIQEYRKVVFMTTLRTAQAFGATHPREIVFVSDMVNRLGCQGKTSPGTTPFNRMVNVHGKRMKVCSWLCDTRRLDPLDSGYLICDDRVTTFHRGMRLDDVLLRRRSRVGVEAH